jgi:3'-phosphoadenosine 5'-phosphosulfate sulfotransferase (PAPS reductase)/FAD synthetase
MDNKWQQTFELWSETEEYKKHIRESKLNIKSIKDKKCIILYSGGKDSSVLLHLCMQIDRQIPVYFFNAGYDYESQQMKMPSSIVKEIIQNAKLLGAKTIYVRGGYGPTSKRFFGYLSDIKKKHNIEVELLGIRQEESSTRKIRAKIMFKYEGNRRVCFPIRHLTWKDVWGYIISNKLPYLSIYDKYADLVGWNKVRFTHLFSKGLLHWGGSYYLDGFLMPEFRHIRY